MRENTQCVCVDVSVLYTKWEKEQKVWFFPPHNSYIFIFVVYFFCLFSYLFFQFENFLFLFESLVFKTPAFGLIFLLCFRSFSYAVSYVWPSPGLGSGTSPGWGPESQTTAKERATSGNIMYTYRFVVSELFYNIFIHNHGGRAAKYAAWCLSVATLWEDAFRLVTLDYERSSRCESEKTKLECESIKSDTRKWTINMNIYFS